MALVDGYAQTWVDLKVCASTSHMEMLDNVQTKARAKLQAFADEYDNLQYDAVRTIRRIL